MFSNDGVSDGQDTGYVVASSNGDIFAGDTATHNLGGGFWLQFSDNNTLINDTAYDNTDQGFILDASSFVSLTQSSSTHNSEDGFFVTTPFRPVTADKIANDTAKFNGNAGFDLQSAFNTSLEGDLAVGNRFAGFQIYGGAHDSITKDSALNNSLYGGFAIWQTNSDAVTSDNASQNGYTGFDLSGASNNSLSRDYALSNGKDGFLIESSSKNNTVGSNSANSNRGYGILDNSTGSGTLTTSTAYLTNECNGNSLGNSYPPGLCSPPVAGPIIPSSATIDRGQAINLTGSASGGTPPYDFSWFQGGVCSGTASSVNSTFAPFPTANSSYSFQARDSSPARAYAACSGPAFITVNPALTVVITPPGDSVFPWTQVDLNASATGGTRPFSYQWYQGSSCTAKLNGTASSYEVGTLPSDATFSVKVTDGSQGLPRAAVCEPLTVRVFPAYLLLASAAAVLVVIAVLLVAKRGRRHRETSSEGGILTQRANRESHTCDPNCNFRSMTSGPVRWFFNGGCIS